MAGRPRKGAFRVAVLAAPGRDEVVVAETGPELRPFPALKALDLDALGDAVLAALDDDGAPPDALARHARRSEAELLLDDLDDE